MATWKILLSPPEMSTVERDRLLAGFDSGWVAPAGPDLDAFEGELAALTGARAVAALSSGTAGLHLALLAAGVRAGDDVLIPTTTFAAPAFATTYVGARPCFLDIDANWQLDPTLLEAELAARARNGRRPAAVIAVHLYGAMGDMARIAELCAHYEVALIEDAAESLGTTLHGRPAGRFGLLGVLSFNGNKIVTTGGGGAIFGDDVARIDHCRFLATQARAPVAHYEHHEVGFNYRLGNLAAAIGRGQLATLATRLARRRHVHAGYVARLASTPGIGFQPIQPGCEPNHWLTVITLDPDQCDGSPGTVLAALHCAGIEARPGFTPMHHQPVFASAPMVGGDRADRLAATSICLPSGGDLSDQQLDWICSIVTDAAHR